MNVEEIVKEVLKSRGYDGLFNESGECGCLLVDLAPCGEMSGACQAGYKVLCPEVDGLQIVSERKYDECKDFARWDPETSECSSFVFCTRDLGEEVCEGFKPVSARPATCQGCWQWSDNLGECADGSDPEVCASDRVLQEDLGNTPVPGAVAAPTPALRLDCRYSLASGVCQVGGTDCSKCDKFFGRDDA